MTWTLPDLIRHAVTTIFNPREAAEELLAQRIQRRESWLLLVLVTILSVIAVEGTSLVLHGLGLPGLMAPIGGGFGLTVVQLTLAVLMVFCIYWGGRMFGGTGRFTDVIVLVAWLQFVLLCMQVLQVLMIFLLPILATYVSIIAIGLFFWLITNFVAVIHGFERLGRVFAGILGGMFAIGFVLTLILAIIGFQVPEVS